MITSKLNIVRNGLFAFRFSFLASLLLVATGLASCSEDDDTDSNNATTNTAIGNLATMSISSLYISRQRQPLMQATIAGL